MQESVFKPRYEGINAFQEHLFSKSSQAEIQPSFPLPASDPNYLMNLRYSVSDVHSNFELCANDVVFEHGYFLHLYDLNLNVKRRI